MEFNGAVLVDNEKIQVAIDNANSEWKIAKCLRQTARNVVSKEVESWSKFKRWWWKEDDDRGDFGIWLNRNSYMFEHEMWVYSRFGVINNKDFELWCDLWETVGLVGNELEALIGAGKPVYLNPTQARFVNKWQTK